MCAGMLTFSGLAMAEDSGDRPPGAGWEAGTHDGIEVFLRPVKGTPVHEVWVHTVLSASARDLQDALTDPDRFYTFMPHLKEARYVGDPGRLVSITYTLLDPPVIGRRDYVSEVRVLEEVQPGGEGTFHQTWRALVGKLPKRHGVVRLEHNEGSWRITARPDGRSDVHYRLSVAPGGMVPGALAIMAARGAVVDTIRSVEKEARRRGAARMRSGTSAQRGEELPPDL